MPRLWWWTSPSASGRGWGLTRTQRLGLTGGLVLALGLGTATWLAFAPLPARSPADRELLYVIPQGTAASGGQVALPPVVRLQVGVRDILVLRNDDVVPMTLGPVQLAPGQTYRIAFHQYGALQLACSYHQGIGFVLFIDPPPAAGWERLVWRLGWARR